MAFPIRRATPQRPPLNKGNSRLFQPPAAVVVAGTRAVIVRAAQKVVARRAGNDLNSGIGPIIRGGAQWIQAPQYNSGGLVPRRAQALRRPVPTRGLVDSNSGLGPVAALRGGTQWVQAQYNSSGLAPSLLRGAPRRPAPRRGLSSLQLAAAYNSGGLTPLRAQGVRRPTPTRGLGDTNSGLGPVAAIRSQWVQAQYTSGGLAPSLLRSAVARPASRPTRSRLFSAQPIAVLAPSLTRALRRPTPKVRPAQLLQAAQYNSGGLSPIRSQGVRRQAAARAVADSNTGLGPVSVIRGGALWIQAPPAVVGQSPSLTRGAIRKPARVGRSGLQLAAIPLLATPYSLVNQGVRRKPAKVGRSRLVVAFPAAVVAGLRPALIRAQRRPVAKVHPAQFILAPASAVVVPDGDSPNLFQPLRQPAPVTRAASRRQIPPTFAPGPGSAPYFTRAIQKPLPKRVRASSQWLQAPVYNSGGLLPLQVQGVRRRAAKVAAARLLQAALYNSGGLSPLRAQGLRRPAAKVRPSQSIQPSYNSGGLLPQRFQGIRRLPIKAHVSQFLQAALYNAGGLTPLRSRATQKPTPKRSSSRLVIPPSFAPSVGAQPFLLRVHQKPSLLPQGGRPRLYAPPATVQAQGQAPQLARALRRKGIPRSNSRLVTPPPLFVAPTPLRTRGVTRKGILRTPSHWSPAPLYNSGGLTPARTRGLPRKGIPRTPSRWAPALPYNSGGVTPSTVRGVCRKPGPVKPSRLIRSAPYNSGGLKPLFRTVPRQKPPTRPRSFLPLTGVVNLGLSRDITLLLGLPQSRWQARLAGGHWAAQVTQGRWASRLAPGRWQVGNPDERWKDRPANT